MEESGIGVEQEIKGQGLFVSRFTHNLDSKRRLTIPSEWRAQVGEPRGLCVLRSIHHKCLSVFPAKAVVQRLERLRQHSFADKNARQFARTLGMQSELLVWDTQGRIRIKDELLDFAGVTEQVELVGAFDCFELWNPAGFKETIGADQTSLADAARFVGF